MGQHSVLQFVWRRLLTELNALDAFRGQKMHNDGVRTPKSMVSKGDCLATSTKGSSRLRRTTSLVEYRGKRRYCSSPCIARHYTHIQTPAGKCCAGAIYVESCIDTAGSEDARSPTGADLYCAFSRTVPGIALNSRAGHDRCLMQKPRMSNASRKERTHPRALT